MNQFKLLYIYVKIYRIQDLIEWGNTRGISTKVRKKARLLTPSTIFNTIGFSVMCLDKYKQLKE